MAKAKTTKPKKPAEPTYPKISETFADPSWSINNVALPHPRVGNGDAQFRRYRVTVELIDEPQEALADRVHKMWRETNNHHHRMPLRTAAAELGIELDSREFGADVKKER